MMSLSLFMLIMGAVAAGSASSLDGVADVQLRDQYGQQDSLAAHRGHVVVVMVVTARRLRNIRQCERELRGRFEGVHFLRIADVPADSPATHESVADKLAEHVPDGVSVLIDTDRVWATGLGLDTERPNLLIFDSAGSLVTTLRGLCRPELVAPAIARLEVLLGGS